MTQDEVLQTLREVIEEAENFTTWTVSTPHLVELVKRAVEVEREAVMQAVTDPENQPSQYGTVTLDYHLEKLKEWEDRFEKLSDRALAQPAQREWVGLTGEDFSAIKFPAEMRFPAEFRAGARWAEAKLKEKNFD